jgi:DNA gyrase/topoisomerase IV subunit A
MESSKFINEISREYGLYVLDFRAIPSLADGLKTSQRIALWLLRNKNKEIKTSGLVGSMLESQLYVHGDAAAADMISRLAAPYLNNCPLINGEGNFGTRIKPSAFGAPRYTEVMKSKFTEDFMYVDLDIIPMQENHDGSSYMPTTFLPLIPMVLVNGVRGIAVGYSTYILPRKLSDIKKAVKDVLTHGEVKTKLLPHYENYDVDVIPSDIKNKYIIRGKLNIKNTTTVEVTEIPNELQVDSFRDFLSDLEEKGKIKSFLDASTDKISIEIKMSRMELEKHNEDSLIEFLKLRTYVQENIVILSPDGSGVKTYDSINLLIKDFVEWRIQWYLERYKQLVAKEEAELLFWKSYISCQNGAPGINSLPKTIHSLRGRAKVLERISALIEGNGYVVDKSIVEKLCDLPMYRWSKERIEEAMQRITETEAKITTYQELVANPALRIKQYLTEI